jgi:hypothetical protein
MWFRSYLLNRCQFIEIKDTDSNVKTSYKSTCKIVKFGVPQGSVLGPLLFLSYINDLIETIQGAKWILYADDIKLLITGKDKAELQCKIINIMKEPETWVQYNNLIINIKKAAAMSFHLTQWRDLLRSQIVFKNTEIAHQSEVRFLGIHMTDTLKWCAHVRFLKAKLCKVVYMVKILQETVSPHMIRTIYFSIVESSLRYGIILWGGDRVSDSIFKLQKYIFRVISGVSSRK